MTIEKEIERRRRKMEAELEPKIVLEIAMEMGIEREEASRISKQTLIEICSEMERVD